MLGKNASPCDEEIEKRMGQTKKSLAHLLAFVGPDMPCGRPMALSRDWAHKEGPWGRGVLCSQPCTRWGFPLGSRDVITVCLFRP